MNACRSSPILDEWSHNPLLRRRIGVGVLHRKPSEEQVHFAGKPLAGDISVGRGETAWSFTPREFWKSGAHNIVALGMLEDLAGNRIGRAFEVDQFDRSDQSAEPERTLIPFQIR